MSVTNLGQAGDTFVVLFLGVHHLDSRDIQVKFVILCIHPIYRHQLILPALPHRLCGGGGVQTPAVQKAHKKQISWEYSPPQYRIQWTLCINSFHLNFEKKISSCKPNKITTLKSIICIANHKKMILIRFLLLVNNIMDGDKYQYLNTIACLSKYNCTNTICVENLPLLSLYIFNCLLQF